MTWTIFKTSGSGFRYDGIRVTKIGIIITNGMRERFVGVGRVILKIDKDRNAIALEPTEKENEYKIFTNKNTLRIGCRINREMPIGRYYFKEKTDDGFVFIFDNVK